MIATARDVSKFNVALSEADRARLHLVQMDLTDPPEKIQSAVADGLAAWGRIDVLINNAAWAPKSLLEEARCVCNAPAHALHHSVMLSIGAPLQPFLCPRCVPDERVWCAQPYQCSAPPDACAARGQQD